MPGEAAASAITLGELAFRIIESAEPNAWVVAVTELPSVASLLWAELEQLRGPEEMPPMVVTVDSIGGLLQAAHTHPRGAMIVTGAHAFSVSHWRQLDLHRSRLMRDGITVLVLDEASAGRLENIAPNLASWIGGRVWRLTDDTVAPALSLSEVEQRLTALRTWSGRGDDEVIRLARAGQLPRDPEYAEWLTLLGQGELLVP